MFSCAGGLRTVPGGPLPQAEQRVLVDDEGAEHRDGCDEKARRIRHCKKHAHKNGLERVRVPAAAASYTINDSRIA